MDIATGAIGSIISKLAELLKAEYKLQTGVKKQVEGLTRELESANAFLREIDKVPPDQLNELVNIWAYEIREASYDMEDILDTFLVSIKRPKTTENNKLKRLQEKMSNLFSKSKARHSIGNAIEEVKEKLKEIDERRRRYKLNDLVVSPGTPSSHVDPRIARVHGINASMLVGIDEAKKKVLKMLSHADGMSAKKTKVVSLVGFGGVGKTTLAKAAYDWLKQNYECGAFVSVGQRPDVIKVLKIILFYLDEDKLDKINKLEKINSTQLGTDVVIRELLDFLRDKRYLIVIDDVWDTESRQRIIEALTNNNIGSRIIITTRKEEVATGEVYKVQPLSYNNSRKLFYTRIFGGEDKCPDNQRQKVSEVADKILKKCDGVPLAIITIASLLVGKSMEEWYQVCNSTGSHDKGKDQKGDTMWILSLSYHDLPSYLKTCLLYLSVFPEDYFIEKDVLIWMWIGEGFVNGKPGTWLFEIGEGYFNDLINRSLIQPVEKEESKIIEGCRVHDMILDLIRSLSQKTNFAMVSDNGENKILGSNARRLSLQNRVEEDSPHDNPTNDQERARSLITFRCSLGSWALFQSFKLLRVLCFEAPINRPRPNCQHVGDLHHLRYLGIRNANYLELPKEIGYLKFLQVLYLECHSGLLPSSLGMLTQLICLRARGMMLPGEIIKDLTALQELQTDPVEDMSRGQFVKDLGKLRELRVLKTSIVKMDQTMQSDLLKSLGNLHKLQRLELNYGKTILHPTTWNKGLALLPRGLCQLDIPIAGYKLPPCIDPSRLPTLSHLALYMDSIDDQGLKILGGLPELRYLKLCIADIHSATLISTTAHVYFQKLTSCLVPLSMVHFMVTEEVSSVSFYSCYDTLAFGSKMEESYKVARAIMPNLEVLYFEVDVMQLTVCKNGSCDNLGLECLASLQKVTVGVSCWDAPVDMVEKEEAALRHAIQVHPNQPTLQIKIYGEPQVDSESGDDNDDLTQKEE